jgi:6-phosphogluconolactonase
MKQSIRALGLLSGMCLLAPCAAEASELFYIGTQTDAMFGARLDETSGQLSPLGLVARVERPTWVLAHTHLPVIYSVSEVGNDGKSDASVYSFAVDPQSGALKPINKVGSGGGGATHLAIDSQDDALFVANFGTGKLSLLPVASDGSLLPATSVQTEQGKGPHPRQASSHAHGVAVSPDGRFVLEANFGADKVFIYRFDAAAKTLVPAQNAFVGFPPGSGPRHPLFHPNGRLVFVNTELVGGLNVYRWDPDKGSMDLIQTLITDTSKDVSQRSAAEIALARDGRHLYVANRGDNVLLVYALDARTGNLTEIQRIEDPGNIPWSFSIDPSGKWMIVANQASSALAVLRIDPASGKLSLTGQELPVPVPVSVAFLPH